MLLLSLTMDVPEESYVMPSANAVKPLEVTIMIAASKVASNRLPFLMIFTVLSRLKVSFPSRLFTPSNIVAVWIEDKTETIC